MPSKAEQLAARVTTLLTAATGTTGALAVYRDRHDAIAREDSPVTLVECIDEDTETLGGDGPFALAQQDRDVLRIAVTQCVRSANWQSVADGLRVASHALIVTDATLRSVLAGLRRDRCEWRAASADLPFGYCAQIYRFTYLTQGHALDSSL